MTTPSPYPHRIETLMPSPAERQPVQAEQQAAAARTEGGVSRRSLLLAGLALGYAPYAEKALGLVGLAGGEVNNAYPDIATAYKAETSGFSAFAKWSSLVTDLAPDGSRRELVDAYSGAPTDAGSLNKLPTAVTILAHIDAGNLSFDQKVAVPSGLANPGETRQLRNTETIDSLLRTMIIGSSDEAFRAIQAALPGHEINKTLGELGFKHTVLEPSHDSSRYFTGMTTPKDIHNLLLRLADGTLLSQKSSAYLCRLLLDTTYNAGIRNELNEGERGRVANKYGRLSHNANEAGIIFKRDQNGVWLPSTVYAFMAEKDLPDPLSNAVIAAVHARFGRTMMNTIERSRRI